MFKLYWLVAILLSNSLVYSQTIFFPTHVDSSDYESIINTSISEYVQEKEIPDTISLQTFIALSRYPELKNVNIAFKFKKIKTSMACRPNPLSIFKKKSKRKYTIFINNQKDRKEAICIQNLSFNAQVGVIGHELGHVIDYQQRTGVQIIGVAIKYNSQKWRSKFEKSVDSIAFNRGFGWQLYEFSNYIQTNEQIPEKYRAYKRKVYYRPEDIILIIKQLTLRNWLIFNSFSIPQ